MAKHILPCFPADRQTLYEPFAGSAAITIASAYYDKARHFWLNDINSPLMDLWDWIVNYPEGLSDGYAELWNAQRDDPKDFYGCIRERFNANPSPADFLYLLARGVKGAIRYNSYGQYNQSPDNRRLGKNPVSMREDIIAVSELLKGRATITSVDYREVTSQASLYDLVYLDPPYQGTSNGRDNRYFAAVSFDDLVGYLDELNSRNVPWILSYDGQTGDKIHGKILPVELEAQRIEVNAGRSSQATLNGRSAETIESVYLSKGLVFKNNMA